MAHQQVLAHEVLAWRTQARAVANSSRTSSNMSSASPICGARFCRPTTSSNHNRQHCRGRPSTVLAIIAYKQPVARSAIERIRGSNSDSALDPLLTRELGPGSGWRRLRTRQPRRVRHGRSLRRQRPVYFAVDWLAVDVVAAIRDIKRARPATRKASEGLTDNPQILSAWTRATSPSNSSCLLDPSVRESAPVEQSGLRSARTRAPVETYSDLVASGALWRVTSPLVPSPHTAQRQVQDVQTPVQTRSARLSKNCGVHTEARRHEPAQEACHG
jgi:hypothetical protein